MKKVLGNRVLVEEIITSEESVLILTDEQKKDNDKVTIERKILMLGDEVAQGRLEIGDIPVFSKYAMPDSVKVVTKSEKRLEVQIVMHVDNIVGLDDLDIK